MSIHKTPPTRHPLEVRPGAWDALLAATYSEWHVLTHAQAGRHCVDHVQLCLALAWRTPSAQEERARVEPLVSFLASSGSKVEVLFVASTVSAELRLRWVQWHAPPMASELSSSIHPAVQFQSPGAFAMSFFSNLFKKSAPVATPQHEPQLTTQPSEPVRGMQLPLALSQIADWIAQYELHDFRQLGMTTARYRVLTLNFSVSAANLQVLQKLMDLNMRDPAAASSVVRAGFARSRSVDLLETTHMGLVFTPDTDLPQDAAEVLVVAGRDTVRLPYTYEGEIDLKKGGAAGGGGTAAAPAASAAATASIPAPLCVWLQMADQPVASRWLITQASVVGADSGCDIPVDWNRTSSRHLRLEPDAQGRWTVVDHSTNGTLLLDAETAPTPGNPPERPLSKDKAENLPRAGFLRLGAGANDPLLHFAQLPTQDAIAHVASPLPARRVTKTGEVVLPRRG